MCVQIRLRRSYDLAKWSTHFASEEAARDWAHGPVRVTIVAAYIAMVDLTREAVRFVQERHGDDEIEVCCASADAIQGETLDYMVLALPPSTSQWSEWLCDPSRLLTVMSRYRWQLAMTHVVDDGIWVHAQSRRDSVQVVLDLQQNADTRCWRRWGGASTTVTSSGIVGCSRSWRRSAVARPPRSLSPRSP